MPKKPKNPKTAKSTNSAMPPKASDIPKSHHHDRRAADLLSQGSAFDPNELLCTKELAKRTKLSTQFYEIGRSRGYGPVFLRCSTKRIRYRWGAVLEWYAECAHRATSEYTGPKGNK